MLIGDNAFIGVSHLSQDLAREKVEKLRIDTIVEVIKKSMSCGATGFTFSTHPTNLHILKTLRDTEDTNLQFGICPLLPYAAGYMRAVSERGMSGLIQETLSRLPLSARAKALVEGGISAIRFDPVSMLKAYVDMELSSYLSVKPRNAYLQTVLLHQVIVDLGLSFQLKYLFDSFIEHIRNSYHVKPGFVTGNFVRFVKFFRDSGLSLRDIVIMTPFNSIGFQMSPSRESCETCLSSLSEGDVIAMSILAGGYLRLREAAEYLRTLPNLSGVAVGVSSTQHAEETFLRLRTLSAV